MIIENRPAVCFHVVVECSLARVYFHSFYTKSGRVPIICSPIFRENSEEFYQFAATMTGLPVEKLGSLPDEILHKGMLKVQCLVSYDGDHDPWQVIAIKPNISGDKIMWPKMNANIPYYWLPGYGKRRDPPAPEISLADEIAKL